MAAKAKIGILGASGYTGAELVRLLLRHPRVELTLLTADSKAGRPMADVFPQFAPFALPDLVAIPPTGQAVDVDLVFCALPHAHDAARHHGAARRPPGDQGRRPLGRFPPRRPERLCALVWPRAPGARSCKSEAVYGLTEVYRDKVKRGPPRRQSRLLHDGRAACRCCRSSGREAIEPDDDHHRRQVGRHRRRPLGQGGEPLHRGSEGFHAYGVGHHRHMAELDEQFSLAAGRPVSRPSRPISCR